MPKPAHTLATHFPLGIVLPGGRDRAAARGILGGQCARREGLRLGEPRLRAGRAGDVARWRSSHLGGRNGRGDLSKGLVAARMHGQLIGAIRSRQLNPRTGWFGALAVDVAHGGRGVGAQLVTFAEAQARAAGATTMQLELLAPLDAHPHTERLAAWYARLGYREARRCGLAEVQPDAVPFAAVALEVAVMHKQLSSGPGSRAVDAEAPSQ